MGPAVASGRARACSTGTKNPFFEHADAEYFLAERDGAVVGRIAAISNRLHNEIQGDQVGFFGFFECERGPGRRDALFDAAAAWCRTRGHDTLRGPASFSTNDECGLLVWGFDTPPTVMMPHNPDLVPRLVGWRRVPEGEGPLRIRRAANEAGSVAPERIAAGDGPAPPATRHDHPRARHEATSTGRSAGSSELYNACWERNWGFVPMTEREIDHLAEQFKPVVVPDLVPFVEKDGKLIGFGLALPDLNAVFRTNRKGYLLPVLPAAALGAQAQDDPTGPGAAAGRPARVAWQGYRRDALPLDLDPRWPARHAVG